MPDDKRQRLVQLIAQHNKYWSAWTPQNGQYEICVCGERVKSWLDHLTDLILKEI